jgi:SAM-dependent methyltransferase
VRLSWKVDPETRAVCWKSLRDAPKEMAKEGEISIILDLGSSNGAFGRLISGDRHARIVGVDISREVSPAEGVEFVQADILRLPFKNESFDLVSARAILHHVPNDLDKAVKEAGRVLRDGRVFLCQEPTSDNFLSELARRVFQTVIHDPSERALSSAGLIEAVSKDLKTLDVRHHLVFTYLIPHIGSRLGGLCGRAILGLAKLLVSVDERLISRGSFWQRRAAYVTISAVKTRARPHRS